MLISSGAIQHQMNTESDLPEIQPLLFMPVERWGLSLDLHGTSCQDGGMGAGPALAAAWTSLSSLHAGISADSGLESPRSYAPHLNKIVYALGDSFCPWADFSNLTLTPGDVASVKRLSLILPHLWGLLRVIPPSLPRHPPKKKPSPAVMGNILVSILIGGDSQKGQQFS